MTLPQPATSIVVLVVEDEPILRLMAIDLVEELGFEALEACDADAALALLELREDINIVFSDIQMPGSINGQDLAHLVYARWPSIRVILTSGHCRQQDIELLPTSYFFSKPYDDREIQRALKEAAG